MLGDSEDVSQHVRMQVTKWRLTTTDLEDLLFGCGKTDDHIDDLLIRCRGPNDHGKTDLEFGQEAIIRSRIKAAEMLGIDRPGKGKKKTQQDRKMELLELRHELAKTMVESPAPVPAEEESPGRKQKASIGRRQSVFGQVPAHQLGSPAPSSPASAKSPQSRTSRPIAAGGTSILSPAPPKSPQGGRGRPSGGGVLKTKSERSAA